MMSLFSQLATVLLSVALAYPSTGSAVDPATTPDFMWFPTEEGNLIPARLKPRPGQEVRLGSVDDIHYYLYTKANPTNEEKDEVFLDDISSIDGSHFVDRAPLKILVHGFGSSYNSTFSQSLLTEYLKLSEDVNIILLEWSILSESPDYFLAFENAQLVSGHTAKFIDFLVTEGKVTRDKVHLIGYSLGGQVVGQIGSRVAEKIARITALDPALPLFDYATEFNKTDPSDAEFVDVIHTAANGLLGYRDPCGHVDWYPNGGGNQPGCGVDLSGYCAHGRAPATFTESVFSTVQFHGRKCATYDEFLNGTCNSAETAVMGYHTPNTVRGVFFLKTKSSFPFALGMDGAVGEP